MPQGSHLDLDHLDVVALKRAYVPLFMRSPAMTDTLSFQCLLQQDSTRITAWIEARGASKGARVAIEGGAGLWEVAEVYQPPRSATWLNENARKVHKGLPAWTRTTDGCPSGKGTRC